MLHIWYSSGGFPNWCLNLWEAPWTGDEIGCLQFENHSQNSKVIDAVQLNLLNNTYCDEHSVYGHFGQTLNENQLCAGIPSNGNHTIPFSGEHQEDFGGPLICLDKSQKPVFTGIASSNSLSTKQGHPGIYTNIYKNKAWIRNVTGNINHAA